MKLEFICPNNKDHGLLSKSKENHNSFRCYKCKGFACWDKDDLVKLKQNSQQEETKSTTPYYTIDFE